MVAQKFHIYWGSDQLILVHQKTFEHGGVKIEEVIPGTSKQDSFGLKYLMVRSMFRRPPKQGDCMYTVVSAYLSITTESRREKRCRRLKHLGLQ